MSNPDLGWAEICHPFHPLKGQRFPVLKTRRIGGVDTLLLGHAERGSFSIAREWTDWGTPSVHSGDVTVCRFDLDMLLELIDLIDQLASSASKKSEIDPVRRIDLQGFVNLPRMRRHGGRYDYWSESSRRILDEFGEFTPCNEPGCELFAIE